MKNFTLPVAINLNLKLVIQLFAIQRYKGILKQTTFLLKLIIKIWLVGLIKNKQQKIYKFII